MIIWIANSLLLLQFTEIICRHSMTFSKTLKSHLPMYTLWTGNRCLVQQCQSLTLVSRKAKDLPLRLCILERPTDNVRMLLGPRLECDLEDIRNADEAVRERALLVCDIRDDGVSGLGVGRRLEVDAPKDARKNDEEGGFGDVASLAKAPAPAEDITGSGVR